MSLNHVDSPAAQHACWSVFSGRAEEAVARQQEAGMRALMSLSGNPEGADVLEVPGALAFFCAAWPRVAQLNQITVFSSAAAGVLEGLLEEYADRGLRPQVRIAEPDVAAFSSLVKEMAVAQEEQRFLVVPRRRKLPLPAEVEIRLAEGEDDQDLWLELFSEAFNGLVRRRGEPGAPDWDRWRTFHAGPGRRMLLAFVDGVPAAQAGYFCRQGTAYLGPACTLQPFRGRGLHAQLLEARLQLAFDERCSLAACGADLDCTSARNQLRAGFTPAYKRLFYQKAA